MHTQTLGSPFYISRLKCYGTSLRQPVFKLMIDTRNGLAVKNGSFNKGSHVSSVGLKYFYVKRRDEIYGPATANQLIRAAREGAVRASDEIAVSSEGPWRPAETCIELGFRQPSVPPSAGDEVAGDDENVVDDDVGDDDVGDDDVGDDDVGDDDVGDDDVVDDDVGDDDEETLFLWDGHYRRGPISMAQLRMLFDWEQVALDSRVSDVDGRLTTAGVMLKLVEEPPPVPIENRSGPPETGPPATPAEPPPKQPPPPLPRRRKRKVEPSFPDLDVLVQMERKAAAQAPDGPTEEDRPAEISFDRSTRRLVHSGAFHTAYSALAVLISIETVVYLLGMCGLSGMYLARLFVLCLEVFVPFESAPEHLVGNDLMLAGLGLTLIACELLLPLFFLYQADLDFRLCLLATLVGLGLSQMLNVEQLNSCGVFILWVLAICGIATAGIGVWIISRNANGRVLSWGLTATLVTVGSAVLLLVFGATDVFEVQLERLPPTLRGSGLSSIMISLCLLGQWFSLPLLCGWMISSQADESTQNYIRGCFIKGVILATFGLISLGFLIGEPSIRFASIPLSLLPLVVGAVMCSFLQSLTWYLHPAYSVRRE